jgi:hypothetical protein
MASQTYSIINLSTNTTATINYITIATTLTEQQHILDLTGWLPPFNSYTAFTGPSTIRTEGKTYVSDESDLTKTTTATTVGTTLYLNNNTDIGNGWVIFNENYITSGQTVASTPGTNRVIMSANPDVIPFSSGTAITFIPPEYLLTVNNTSNLEVGWSASGNGYTGQTIEEIRGGGVLKMSGQPSSNPSPGGSITFTSNEDVMLLIPPASSSTFVMDYTRVTSVYGTYVSRVNIYGDLGGSFNKVVNNFMLVSPSPVVEPESPFYVPNVDGGGGAGGGPGACGVGAASAAGCSCFTADTLITMADGSKKRIVEITEGDLIQGLTGINKVSKLLNFEFPSSTLYGFNGREPFVTACHPIKTDKGWAAFDPELLKNSWPSDWKNLVDENNGPVEQINEQSNLGFWENGSVNYQKIDKILTIDTPPEFKVYNLVVTNDHTFIAEELVVHNKCFEAGTRVLLADGTVKNIEDVEVGEYLLGEDRVVNKVREHHRPLLGLKDDLLAQHSLDSLRMVSINGGLFRASEDHLFKTPEGWKAVNNKKSELIHADMLTQNGMVISELTIGDTLITNNGELIPVEHIQIYNNDDPNLQLYNFKLTGNNTYYVELFDGTFILVHNKECFRLGTLISMADGTFKEIEEVVVGDRVLSADGKRINTVKYIEHSPIHGTLYETFYAPKGIKPFATENHPIVVGNKWVGANAKLSQKLYPWIDTDQLSEFDTEPTNGQVVWNLWVDGDHTYQVNTFGTHSLVGDGGWARISVEQGYMTKEQITHVTHGISNSSSIVAYGALLLSNLIAWLDMPWLTKYVADMMLGNKSKLPMNAAIITVGSVAMTIRKIKRIFRK